MGYTGNRTIADMQKNCSFVRITGAGPARKPCPRHRHHPRSAELPAGDVSAAVSDQLSSRIPSRMRASIRRSTRIPASALRLCSSSGQARHDSLMTERYHDPRRADRGGDRSPGGDRRGPGAGRRHRRRLFPPPSLYRREGPRARSPSHIYAVLRHGAALDWWIARAGGTRSTAARSRLLAALALVEGWPLGRRSPRLRRRPLSPGEARAPPSAS